MLLVVCSSAYGQGKTDILAAAAGNIKAGTVIGFDFSATDGKGKKIYEEGNGKRMGRQIPDGDSGRFDSSVRRGGEMDL